MQIVDKEGKPLERGIYEVKKLSSPISPSIALFYQDEGGTWMSKTPEGEVSPIGGEKGADARFFSRVSELTSELYKNGVLQNIAELRNKLSLLEEGTRMTLPPVQQRPDTTSKTDEPYRLDPWG